MAYSEEEKAIVIDGFQNGIASSPYLGIGSMMNVNTSYYSGVAYVNYRRQASSLSGDFWYAGTHSIDVSNNDGWIFDASASDVMTNPVAKAVSPIGLIYILDDTGQIFKQSAVNSTGFGLLGSGTGRIGSGNGGLAYWNNYLVVFGDGLIEFCGLGTNDSDVISTNWNINQYDSVLVAASTSPSELIYGGRSGEVYLNKNDAVTFTTTGTLPAPLVVGTTYYIKANVDPILGEVFQISATVGGADITFTTTGTGVHTIVNLTSMLPIGNIASINFTVVDTTHFTITSYVDPSGNTITDNWAEPTGHYQITDPNGNKLLALFTNASPTIVLDSPYVQLPIGTYSVQILDTSATSYKTWISKVDGNLYFANGRNLGRILSQNTNISFAPSYAPSYTVDFATTELLQPDDKVVDMTDLKDQLVIAGNKDTYTWDYVSSNVTAPVPIGEQTVSITNLLNNIYILAGQKGNIYVSNGYSSQLFYKMPDFIAGVIDPVWTWGGIMTHRSKLFFQALAQTSTSTNILAGIFSLIASPSAIGETANGLVMEAQNSYGLTPTSGATGAGLLIDNSPSSTGFDQYYSAWSNGATDGGIDYNDTSGWQNYEPTIETDLIPIGTILDKKTFGLIEFKLDRPMVTGDEIRMYFRTSLTEAYTLMGTTTTAQLSDYYKSNIFQGQWAQFKIQMKCASSASSFIPLREVRIHHN